MPLVFEAYAALVKFEVLLARNDFVHFYGSIRDCPVSVVVPPPGAIRRITAAVDVACVWYWKRVLCFQRSAATAWLLKRHGVGAEMVIGAQQLPFKAHAWVEVEGAVVNDKPYMKEIYQELDRC